MADEKNPQLPLEGGTPPGGNLIFINIEEEMRRSYLDYSMSVIIGRALPDARDGLKPVHRRVLYTMSEMGLEHNKKYTKCAKVVGQAMGVYHPHGDSAIYDTLVRMAQPFSLRYPLIDGQGNFGSVDGDPPAAMRYTECRMERIAGELLADIDMETVDFVPNYDESTLEPTVLPTRIPNLIVNGSNGIAVGMATNIPPHNLTEIINATIELVNDPRAGLLEVLKHVQGPDFPTGGFVYGKSGIAQAYKTGRGRFMMRARVATENLTKEKQAIIVTEIPYQVNKSKLIERIAELANEKIVDEISDVRDESDRDGMRIVIELKRGSQPEIVLNQLYKHTQLQESFSMIFLAVLNGQPRELGLDQAIRAFIDHRVDVVQRRTVYLLRKAREREHILEGYKIALDNLDTVIRIIRGSGSRAEARENLYAWGKGTEIVINLDRERLASEERGLSLRQVDAILELQLYRLTQLSVDEILSELKEIRDKIAEYESILASEKKLRRVIVKELEEVRTKYGDERRTQIVDESAELQLEDLIADEQVAVTVSHQGYLKRTPISIYRQQRRGGTGRMGMKTREEDFVAQLIVDSTHAYLMCFTNTGRVYWVKVYEVPDVGAAGKGKSMQSLLNSAGGRECAGDSAGARPGRRGQVHLLCDAAGHSEKDAAEGLLQRDVKGYYRHRYRQGRRVGGGAHHRRLADRLPGDAPGHGDSLRRVRRAFHGTAGVRRARHRAGQERLRGGCGDHSEGARARRVSDSGHNRKRLRQAHGRRRVSSAVARRQGREEHGCHRTHWEGELDSAGRGHERVDGHQPVGQDHSHRHEADSRRRASHAGRAAAEPGCGG